MLTLPALEPYGGTRTDAHMIGEVGLPLGLPAVVDLPMSFAVDTALLPVTVSCKIAGVEGDELPSEGAPGRAFD